MTGPPELPATRVYTDGACRGNPGPGGWAWAVHGGPWAAGHDPDTTNQRMEIRAVIEATRAIDGPLVVVSDSTYVVHCWRDGWWKGWIAKGWRNSQRKPVANRDLWEALVPVFRDRGGFSMEWVKGHGSDPMNDLVDRLAVAGSYGRGGSGHGAPPAELIERADRPGPTAGSGPVRSGTSGDPIVARDGRVPEGWRLVVIGRRGATSGDTTSDRRCVVRLAEVLAAQQELHPDLVVLSGLRAGAEASGARAALLAGVRYVAVLPYPDPLGGRPDEDLAEFQHLLDAAERVVTLERRRPAGLDLRRASLGRRDGWLRSVADAAIVVTDGEDPEAELAVRRFGDAVGDELWELRVEPS